MTESSHDRLDALRRERPEQLPDALALRLHRALSWLRRAEAEPEDPDARFLFLWIAFNAAYAEPVRSAEHTAEARRFNRFFRQVCRLDKQGELYELIWQRYPGPIRVFLDNRYVFQPFWDHHNGESGAQDWERRFANHRRSAHRALARRDTAMVLSRVFAGLYTLRNQLVHGGATWSGRVNREQVQLGAQILGDVVPRILELMRRHPEAQWGRPPYPPVDSGGSRTP